MQLGLLEPTTEMEVMMFTSDPANALVVAHTRGRELRAEAAAERLCGTSGARRALAVFLRRAANRLDPAALAAGPPFSPEVHVKEA
jgi:hypothetical protein